MGWPALAHSRDTTYLHIHTRTYTTCKHTSKNVHHIHIHTNENAKWRNARLSSGSNLPVANSIHPHSSRVTMLQSVYLSAHPKNRLFASCNTISLDSLTGSITIPGMIWPGSISNRNYRRTSNYWIVLGEKLSVYRGARGSRRSVFGPNEDLKARLSSCR